VKKYPNPPKPKVPRCDGVGVKGEYPLCQSSQGIPHIMPQRALEGKAKAGFIYSFNPARNAPDPHLMAEGYKKLDLLVVCDIQWSETAMVAHYVLPECSFVEREDLPTAITGGKPGVTMRCKAIDILHPNTKPFEQIVTELAGYMGLQQYFNFTREEVAAAIIKPTGVTVNDLRSKGTIMLDSGNKSGGPQFKTESNKVELYCKAFADNNYNPLPVWEPPLVKADKRTFVLIHGKQGIMSHTATANIPALLQIAKNYDMERLWINTLRAKRLGIKDGDLVEVSSPQAVKKVRVKVTERVHPEAAYLPAGYGNLSPGLVTGYGFGINPNDFTPHRVEAIAGQAMMMEVLVKLRKVSE
jgi:thiosulfate reductase / polysulfide reductase chain A